MNHLLGCSCGRKIVVNRSQAGQEILCQCGEKLSVPTLRGLSQLPLAESPGHPSPSATTAQVAETAWKGWRGAVISLLAAVLIGAVTCAGYFGLQRWYTDTSYTEEVERQAGRELFDNMDIRDLSATFEQFSNNGLGHRSPPPFYILQEFARQRETYVIYSLSTAGAMLLGMFVILLTRPRSGVKPAQSGW